MNRAQIIGRLGRDPEVRTTQAGHKICTLNVATSERWKDRNTGERKERTEWHRVVIFNEGLAGVAEKYLRKGSQVYLSGKLQTRKWQDRDGNDRYTTEIVLQVYGGELELLDSKSSSDNAGASNNSDDYQAPTQGQSSGPTDDLDDDIPF